MSCGRGIGLRDPGADGRLGGLELACEVACRPAGAVEFDDLLAELRRLGGASAWHGEKGSGDKGKIVHQTGSTPSCGRNLAPRPCHPCGRSEVLPMCPAPTLPKTVVKMVII